MDSEEIKKSTMADSEPAVEAVLPPGVSASGKDTESGIEPNRRIIPWRQFTGALIPNWLLRRREISPGAKLCYARLCQYAGEKGFCWPGQKVLAQELGVSERQVRTYLRDLAREGLIVIEQLGLGQSNRYYFLNHPWVAPHPDSTSAPERQSPSGRKGKGSAVPYIEEKNQKNEELKRVHSPAVAAIPQGESEAIQQAELLGVPREFALKEYNRMVSVGWLDGCRRQVKSWSHYIKQRWQTAQAEGGGRKGVGSVKSSIRGPSIYEWDKQLKAVEALLKEHPIERDGAMSPDVTEKDRAEHRRLDQKRRELLKRIAHHP